MKVKIFPDREKKSEQEIPFLRLIVISLSFKNQLKTLSYLKNYQ